jgi:hypothetical protein
VERAAHTAGLPHLPGGEPEESGSGGESHPNVGKVPRLRFDRAGYSAAQSGSSVSPPLAPGPRLERTGRCPPGRFIRAPPGGDRSVVYRRPRPG